MLSGEHSALGSSSGLQLVGCILLWWADLNDRMYVSLHKNDNDSMCLSEVHPFIHTMIACRCATFESQCDYLTGSESYA